MPRPKYTARNADRHHLYEESVQNADHDAAFVRRLYKRIRGKHAVSMKEDFCGTYAFCCEWVKLSEDNVAYGVDLAGEVLKWGTKHNLSKLDPSQQKRVHILERNVLGLVKPKVDIVSAFNFSYFIFKGREGLKEYFKNAYQSLNKDGIFVMDCFGGSECYLIQEERRACEGFTYVWEHADYSPITGEILCKIHFEFKDGSRMRNAFVYDWRMWSLIEIRELLSEVGFKDARVYWEGTEADTGEGNGVFRPTLRGEACQTWIAYIAAIK